MEISLKYPLRAPRVIFDGIHFQADMPGPGLFTLGSLLQLYKFSYNFILYFFVIPYRVIIPAYQGSSRRDFRVSISFFFQDDPLNSFQSENRRRLL